MEDKLVALDDLQVSTAETFEKTLIAYCVAYGTDPAHIRWVVSIFRNHSRLTCF